MRFSTLQKNRSRYLLTLEEKQGHFWNLHQILIKVVGRYSSQIKVKNFLLEVKCQKKRGIFGNYYISYHSKISHHRKKAKNIKKILY